MESKRTVCLRRLGEGRAEEVRFGRFLANAKVPSVGLAETLCAATAPRAVGRPVLLIEDTPEINDPAHAERVLGLGTEDPIHGRLLTTHRLDSFDDARRIMGGYCPRWPIEQTFRVLKKQGLDVESSPIETAAGLMKLACLAVDGAVRSMQLTLAREGPSDRPATDVFPEKLAGGWRLMQEKLCQRLSPN